MHFTLSFGGLTVCQRWGPDAKRHFRVVDFQIFRLRKRRLDSSLGTPGLSSIGELFSSKLCGLCGWVCPRSSCFAQGQKDFFSRKIKLMRVVYIIYIFVVWMLECTTYVYGKKHDIPKEKVCFGKRQLSDFFFFDPAKVDRFTRVESQGVWGIIEGEVVGAGSKRFLDSMAIDLPKEAEEQVSRGGLWIRDSWISLVKVSVLMKSYEININQWWTANLVKRNNWPSMHHGVWI